MIYVTWTLTVNPEKRTKVIHELEKISMTIRQEAGCITHSFYADLWEPNKIRLYTEFETIEALKAHGQMQHMIKWQAVKQKLVETGAMVINDDGGLYEATSVEL